MTELTTNARIAFSEEILNDILLQVSNGLSLAKVCAKDGYPSRTTFFDWVAERPAIAERYQVALTMRGELFADELIEISDDDKSDYYVDGEGRDRVDVENIQRAKLKVDTRKWIIARLIPKKYGDKLELSGDKNNPIAHTVTNIDPKALTDEQLRVISTIKIND